MNRIQLLLIAALAPVLVVLAAPPATASVPAQSVYCVFTGAIDVFGKRVWPGAQVCVPGP
jgi:hypothetical protein